MSRGWSHVSFASFAPSVHFVVKFTVLASIVLVAPSALAEPVGRTVTSAQSGSISGAAAPVQGSAPSPARKSFAFTLNPLNLIIGRYGFNFEYQPVPHHAFILTPHYDHASADKIGDYGYAYRDTVTGGGAELGYRFYSSAHGFEGLFVGPSMLIATHRLATANAVSPPPEGDLSGSVTFTSIGFALDVGAQWQPGSWIIGAGVGVQYTSISRNGRLNELGFPVYAIVAGAQDSGGWWARLLLNLGYAF